MALTRASGAARTDYTLDFVQQGQGPIELWNATDFGSEAHVRVALPGLRIDCNDVDPFARKNVGHVAQQTLSVIGIDHDIDCKIDGIGAMKLKSEFVKKA